MSCSIDICISNTGVYDDTYTIDGLYNSLDYYTGATNGYYIFYSTTESRWCLAANLGDPCILFGPTNSVNICPDFYSGIIVDGLCPTPTPTPTLPCVIDFDAIFDCDVFVTPTPTPTPTPTSTLTPTPTPTNVCGGVSLDVTANTYSPTPTTTPTLTPTPSSPIDRPCNFDGIAKFNSVDGFIVCATSKKFEDCFTGIEYYTTQTLFDSFGNLLVVGDVYGGTINGISSCFIFQTIVDNISGGDKVVITTEYGPSSKGSCLNCFPISNTPTLTPTITPTPTTPCLCLSYRIHNITTDSIIEFMSCDGKDVLLRPAFMGWTTWLNHEVIICSKDIPTIVNGSATITNIGDCCNGICVQYLLSNLSPAPQTYSYTNLLGVIINQTLNVSQSIIVNSFSTPYSLSGGISVTNTGIDCFLTPTPTPTKTVTPTVTPTNTITTSSYTWFTNLDTYPSSVDNYCTDTYCGLNLYTSTPTITNGIVLYMDNILTIPFVGTNYGFSGGGWGRMFLSDDCPITGLRNIVQVNGSGQVISNFTC